VLKAVGKAKVMNCPRCDIELGSTRVADLEIEECAGCGGTWFEEDELRRAKDRSDPDLAWMDFEIWKHPEKFEVSVKRIRCPRCDIDMAAVEYDSTKIEVDYCLRCQSVWLDAGEFEKIIEALEDELIDKDVPDYIAASLREARQVISGPESLFSEWRDFVTVLRLLEYRVLSKNPRVARALAAIQSADPFR
jgi:Zn-finger nucleic acid-binding protein